MADGHLRQIFRARIPEAHWQSIESWSTGRGVPDANYCLSGHEGWIEFKQAKHWKVGIWPEQVGWIERRARAGGRAFMAVRRAQDELWILAPGGVREAAEGGLKAVTEGNRLGLWGSGPASWDWDAVRRILTS